MLKKQHRLAKTSDIQRAFARGRSFFNPFFTIKYLKSPGAEKRLTVVVSTKVSKKAVVRNRIKRLIREYIRIRLPGFIFGNYVIVVKPSAQRLESKELLSNFEQLVMASRLYIIN